MAPIRRRHWVETAAGKSEKRRDLFSPDPETDGYEHADRPSAGRHSPRSQPDLDCPRQTEWFVGGGEHQSSASEMVRDNSLEQGSCVPV